MLIKACRAVHTERCRVMCKQRGRQHLAVEPDTGADALAELAVASQALAVEARTLAHPVSYEMASSTKGEGIEDRTTMAPLSARRLAEMLDLTARVAAIEFVVAAQAVDLRKAGPLGVGTAAALQAVRELVPFTDADDVLQADLEPVVRLVESGSLAEVGHNDAPEAWSGLGPRPLSERP